MRLFDNEDIRSGSGVSAARNWRKSSRSMTNGNCVEVGGPVGEFVGVRDSVNPEGAVLGFSRGGWGAFVGGVRKGQFDRRGR